MLQTWGQKYTFETYANFPPMSIRHGIAVFLLIIMAICMVWSRAMLSITMGFLAIVSAIDIQVRPFRLKWLLTPANVKNSIRDKPFLWVFGLFTLLYIISIAYAGNLSEWWQLTHPKLAFLLMPMSFAMLGPFSKKEFMMIMSGMIITAVWSTIIVQIAYYDEYYLLSTGIGFGGSLPTPINHIRYSVVIAVCMVLCIAFCIENMTIKYRWERWVFGITGIYLFYFLHILSVRSGLMIGYAGVFILLLFYMPRLKPLLQAAIVVLMIAAPFVAYKTMEGFRLKVNYTLYDFGKYQQGEGAQYSDSERWASWKAGIELGNAHPFFGLGTGRFVDATKQYYKDVLQITGWNRPHNQWINVFAIFGIVGLVVFCFVIVYPMTFALFWKMALLPAVYTMQMISMIVEHPLDTEFGTMLFLMTTCLGLSVVVMNKKGMLSDQK